MRYDLAQVRKLLCVFLSSGCLTIVSATGPFCSGYRITASANEAKGKTGKYVTQDLQKDEQVFHPLCHTRQLAEAIPEVI